MMKQGYLEGTKPVRPGVRNAGIDEEVGFIGRMVRGICRADARFNLFFGRFFTLPVCLILGLLAIAAVTGLSYTYFYYAAIIDQRLQGKFFDQSSGIYAAPRVIWRGAPLKQSELTEYLTRAGYRELKADADKADPDNSGFRVDGENVIVATGRETDAGDSYAPISISFKNDKVNRIENLESQRSLDSCTLKAQLLTTLFDHDRRKRQILAYHDLPPQLIHALVAIEDERYFQHHGIDWRAIGRAVWANAEEGQIVQGGSTITQQLIKNSFLTSERTFKRKLEEAALAIVLELRLDKEQILTLYCNEVYLGQSGPFSIHGFGEAAEVYFGKDLSSLSYPEAALLAGMVRGPSRYSPYRHIEQAQARRNEVLGRMVETGYVTESAAEAYQAQPLNVLPPRGSKAADDVPYFLDYVEQYLNRQGEVELARNSAVYTTVDMQLQKAAHDAVQLQLAKLDKVVAKRGVPAGTLQAALVAMDAHTGEVVAMVGGRDYNNSPLNRATAAFRQPGSVFKPFVYASALAGRGFTAASTVLDAPQTFMYAGDRQYNPGNFGNGYTNRPVTLRYALTHSLNVVTVNVAQQVGISNIADLAENAGLPRPRPYPSSALGTTEATPLQVAAAYTGFANQGMGLTAIPIRSAHVGEATRSRIFRAEGHRVLSPQVAYLMTDLMHSVVTSGTAARVKGYGLPATLAGKTGTSHDGWFAGYTPNLICVVWVGFDDNRQLGLTGADSALPIWAEFMKSALAFRPDLGGDHFSRPGGIDEVEIDPETGLLATPECPTRVKELFILGSAPMVECDHGNKPELIADTTETEGGAVNPIPPVPIDSPGDSMRPSLPPDSTSEPTITLKIDTDTGLIAADGCKNVESRTFKLSEAPTKTCGPQYHPLNRVVFPERIRSQPNQPPMAGPPPNFLKP